MCLLVASLGMVFGAGFGLAAAQESGAESARVVSISPLSGQDAAAQQQRIQAILDTAGEAPRVFRFAPGDYALADAAGWRVPGNATLEMEGARFLLAGSLRADGQAFLLENVSGVVMRGGEIVGRREAWPADVNIAGVRVRGGGDIRIDGLRCHDVSSNAVGVFAADEAAPVRDVTVKNVVAENCCNEYGDYLQPGAGPAPGSVREDQGTIAFYCVEDWSVEGCVFAASHSDGTHFYHSRDGRFVNCAVTGARMGGYFLEGCENVTAIGNVVRDNGSRGVTIERNSRFCVFTGNIVTHSGREGAWMPDVAGIVVANNTFIENGRKDDGEKDCEIRLEDTDEFEETIRDIRIEGNVFSAGAHQTAVIYLGKGAETMTFDNNAFQGPAPKYNVHPTP